MVNSTSTCRLFSKVFTTKKVICSPWLNPAPQLARLSYCMSINKWQQQQHGFISSNNPSDRLKTAIMTNNRCTTIDILAQRKMNLHHISAQKWPHPMETLYGNSATRIKLHPENNTASLNRISRCWSSTDDSTTSSKKTTALTVISDLKELRAAPLPALVLGVSGLIPFVASPLYMIMTSTYVPAISFAQTAYGAVILSFLGGVRWGHAVGNHNKSPLSLSWTSLGQSVVPSLIAWSSLLLPLPFSTLVVAGGIGGLAYFDIVASIYEPWFKALRFVLSFGAVIALWSSIICHLLLSQNQPEKIEEEKENS